MKRFTLTKLYLVLSIVAVLDNGALGDDQRSAGADQLRKLDGRVITENSAPVKDLARMLGRDAAARIRAANQRETRAWRQIHTRTDWEHYYGPRIQALRQALGPFPSVPRDLKVRVTRTLQGDGYRIENLVLESRPGLVVTANLYLPADPPASMPGILICHSHHNPKTQSELQDMGMTWAKLGCTVLVMDQLGHGERRQHPFPDAASYPRPFRVSRQDYHFRSIEGVQLHLIGESLIGWMVWDLMRGVDLLLCRPGIDAKRIIVLGAVAGGGDPSAVAAALDPRIQAVVPFNFGGPQPETTFPLPADPEDAFNYAGGGSWESTRNLRLSARDGFLPWVIVGSAAPRPLIYAHEFSWDQEHDPVWARLQRIYALYEAGDRLAAVHGRGKVTGQPPESTHCNNIGPEHRKTIYPAFRRWFGIAEPAQEYRRRRPANELLCLTPATIEELKPRTLHDLADELGARRAEAARQRLAALKPQERRQRLRQDWSRLLGGVEPAAQPKATARTTEKLGDITVERIVLEVDSGVFVPLVLLLPAKTDARPSIVVAFAQEGKQAFIHYRAETLTALLAAGAAVCLPDLRGTGETRPGASRDRNSAATAIAASELMLGRTLVGLRLRDLRSVLTYLRQRPELDSSRLALWGDSFAPVNGPDRALALPLDVDPRPDWAEPLGGLIALFGALFEDDVRAVYARGGLTGYQALLKSQFCYVPQDAIVPGALTAGDLNTVAAALAPRPLRLAGLVDGLNRSAAPEALERIYSQARDAYRAAAVQDQLLIGTPGEGDVIAQWLLK
jgi:cephalosporin-C deacetylase-like acetyl esterase